MARIKEVTQISIGQIETGQSPSVPHPEAIAHADVEDLVSSFKKLGQLQPIIVSDVGKGKYEIVAGRRRVLAALKLQGHYVWAAILDERVDVTTGNAIWAAENVVRQVSEADLRSVFSALLKAYGSANEVADHTGLSLEKVHRYVGVSR
jgi:ParB family chromosome partitioning protein